MDLWCPQSACSPISGEHPNSISGKQDWEFRGEGRSEQNPAWRTRLPLSVPCSPVLQVQKVGPGVLETCPRSHGWSPPGCRSLHIQTQFCMGFSSLMAAPPPPAPWKKAGQVSWAVQGSPDLRTDYAGQVGSTVHMTAISAHSSGPLTL